MLLTDWSPLTLTLQSVLAIRSRRFSPHSFRVTTITNLLEQGVPLEDVQQLAGHADPRTTPAL